LLAELSVDRFLSDKPLALTVAGLEELRGHIMARLGAFDSAPRDFLAAIATEARAASAGRDSRPRGSAVGVIQVRGTISQHSNGDLSSFLFGGATTEGIAASLREFLADDSISKIVLDIDSPGGSTYGVAELAAEIYKARGQKPIVAVANSIAASAAYWIGASADEFYVTPGGIVGSIGVYAVHQDVSKMAENEGVKTTLISAGKFKTTGNQWEPLDEEAHARIQSRVNDAYAAFIADVARGRGVTEAKVRNGFGEGDAVTAKAAKAEGMVDGIATLDQVIARPIASRGRANEQAAEVLDDAEPKADEEGQHRLALLRLEEQRALAGIK